MTEIKKKNYSGLKKILIAGLLCLIAVGIAVWYIFTKKFKDTATQKADYTTNALSFIREFQKDDSIANKKYTEKIITVNGRVSELEESDTTINIKIIDTTADTNPYVIFSFQQQHTAEAKQLKEGDSVAIKGSCSGGTYSQILETEIISFKRCAIDKIFKNK